MLNSNDKNIDIANKLEIFTTRLEKVAWKSVELYKVWNSHATHTITI